MIALGVASLAATAVVVGTTILSPRPATWLDAREVAVTAVASLSDGVPTLVTIPDDFGLGAKAFDLRSRGGYRPMGPRPSQPELGVWLVRSGSDVHAFIASDPRNGCRLELLYATRYRGEPGEPVLHDICHGSLYLLSGQRMGGPSPWDLDELVASVRGGVVYVDRRSVLPGRIAAR